MDITKKCRACQEDIPEKAKICSHCKVKQWNFFVRHKILTIFLVLILVGTIVWGSKDSNGTKSSGSSPVSNASTEVKNDEKITMEEFQKIKTGMTYDEVVRIVGSKGELSSEVEVGGYHSVLYSFKWDKFASNANVTFSDWKVSSKAQFGLQ